MVMNWREKDGECGGGGGGGGLSAPEEFQSPLFDSVSSERTKHVSFRVKTEFNDNEEIVVNSSEEDSSLGLKLRKTPSFLNLIDMNLAKTKQELDQNSAQARRNAFIAQPMSEKLKASNFPAVALRIGTWERISKHEGDLVAKCYYAKKKLVWEVLDGALKSKIEIQWADICAIRATIQEDKPGILEIELKQPPTFFQETNPQPRKHTLWQLASDFTGGQAPTYRRHYVQFPPNALDKHYEKLLQCDQGLYELSQKPFPYYPTPFFYSSNMYGIGGLAIHFNGCSPEFPNGIYPYPTIHPSYLPSHNAHTFKPNIQPLAVTRQPLAVVDSNTPLSVITEVDFPSSTDENFQRHVYENQSSVLRGLGGYQANPAFGSSGYNVWEEATRAGPNTDILSKIENHLLGNPQGVCSDESTVRSMNSLMEPFEAENFENDMGAYQMQQQYKQGMISDHPMFANEHPQKADGGLPPFLAQPMRCLHPQVCNENAMMHIPGYASPYVYQGQMTEDLMPFNAINEAQRWT